MDNVFRSNFCCFHDKLCHPAILDVGTRSKLGEQGKDGTHQDNLKHSIYDSKHPFVTKNTAFMATVEKIRSYTLGEDDTGPVPVQDGRTEMWSPVYGRHDHDS